MKKIAFHNVYEELNENNFLFENVNTLLGDDLLYPFHLLRDEAKKYNIECGTTDYFKNDKVDAYVFIDFPTNSTILKKALESSADVYLLIFESELISSENWNTENHKFFKKIFTWNDDFVDNQKYFKLNFSQTPPDKLDFLPFKERQFVTMIASNKLEHFEGELYSKRIDAVRWFETNYPDLFDLYGMGWDQNRFSGRWKFLNAVNKLPFSIPRLQRKYPSYRGRVENKRETLKNYKFAICYENFTGVSGYITEKIFDCFFAGVIPIYLGPKNISNVISSSCFIDMRNFNTFEEMYDFLDNITELEFKEYLNNIKAFLNGSKFDQFSAKYFAGKVLKELDL